MLDLTIDSDIQALTKMHIYEYYRFGLLLSIKARRHCAATASVPVIPSVEYTIGVKEILCSRQGWRYFYFFSFSTISRAFEDV